MNRRGFLSLFGAVAAAAALDPERLLWVPGAKVISIPKPRVITFEPGDIITITGRYVVNPRTRKVTDKLQLFVVCSHHQGDGVIATLAPHNPLIEAKLVTPVLTGKNMWSGAFNGQVSKSHEP